MKGFVGTDGAEKSVPDGTDAIIPRISSVQIDLNGGNPCNKTHWPIGNDHLR
jgi:hypothetical protein